VNLVLTCRVADWRGDADLALLGGYLPAESVVSEGRTSNEVEVEVDDAPRTVRSSEAPERPAPIRLVRLAPLSEEQALLLAKESGARKLPELREAVSSSEAWAFLERPADVLSLVGSWNRRGEIGTLTQLMEDMVRARLTEHGDDRRRRARLALEVAQTCAERLALAATVMREPRIRRPVPYDDALRPDGLRVERVLDDVSPAKLAEFLDRGMFVDDGYGLLGFHHRATKEYLAAQHLLVLHQQELSSRRLEGIFLCRSYGEQVVVPSLRGLAGWVASRDATFRHALVGVDPLLLLEHGDPAAITPDERAEILQRVVAFMHGGRWRRPQAGHADFARFGCPEVAPIIQSYLRRPDAEEQVVHFLLRLVAYGRIRENAADALVLALRPESDKTIGYAVQAAANAGDDGVRRQLVVRACGASGARPDLLIEVARCLYPKAMTPTELATIMLRWTDCAGASTHTVVYGSPWYFLDEHQTPQALEEVVAVLGDALVKRLGAAPAGPHGAADDVLRLSALFKAVLIQRLKAGGFDGRTAEAWAPWVYAASRIAEGSRGSHHLDVRELFEEPSMRQAVRGQSMASSCC
jgi:hypothetical protein